jgi:hypothetical protein
MTIYRNADRHAEAPFLETARDAFGRFTLVCGVALTVTTANAADGCTVLLCFAAPSWRAIPQCIPPIREVLTDLARGRGFPSCLMSGAANGASHQLSSAPAFCPPQYTQTTETENGTTYSCDYSGAVSVSINGSLWSRTWWTFGGGTVTEFSDAAKAQLGSWDNQFDIDYAAWLAMQSPPPAPCSDC